MSAQTATTNRQWLLAKRPGKDPITAANFTWHEGPVPEPADGEFLVRNVMLSMEPAQHGWMQGETYLPAIALGAVVRSVGAGEVIASRDPRFAPGQVVQGLFGWQDYAIARADGPYPPLPIPPDLSIASAMSLLGTTGLTAYFGLLEIGQPKPGETVVVSGAAGATGSAAAQIAKIKGCRVVGIAGGPDKCRYLTQELGLDAAIDYKNDNMMTALRTHCPKGVDVFFDNVGGKILDAVLLFLAMHARIVICGAISTYQSAGPAPGPANYMRLLRHRARMEGFVVLDFLSRAPEAQRDIAGWLRDGRIKDRVDIQHGLENAPAALARLFSGENNGKQLLRIADPPPTGG